MDTHESLLGANCLPTLQEMIVLITKKTEDVISTLESAVFSVYAQGENLQAKPEQIGTAFLYKKNNLIYLITAHHVIHNASSVGKVHFLNKDGKCFSLEQAADKGYQTISCKKTDFYIFKVNSLVAEIKPICCAVFDKTEVPDPCISFGFPNSKNKREVSLSALEGKLTALRLHLYNSNFQKKSVPSSDSSLHFLKWGEKKSLNGDGQACNSIKIQGMSGAPCFYVSVTSENVLSKTYQNPSVYLAGVLIEHQHSLIKFIRFHEISKLIL